jgi:hypothetical protein
MVDFNFFNYCKMKTLLFGLFIFMSTRFSGFSDGNNWTEHFNGKNLTGWKANENSGS